MENKIEKKKKCAYCEKDMDVKYRNKMYCSDMCRVYASRRKKYHEKAEKKMEEFLSGHPMLKENLLDDLNKTGVSVFKVEDQKIARLDPVVKGGIAFIVNDDKQKDNYFNIRPVRSFSDLLKAAKGGPKNISEFKKEVAASKLTSNQKEMVLSKIKIN